jgi:hypothetical protein
VLLAAVRHRGGGGAGAQPATTRAAAVARRGRRSPPPARRAQRAAVLGPAAVAAVSPRGRSRPQRRCSRGPGGTGSSPSGPQRPASPRPPLTTSRSWDPSPRVRRVFNTGEGGLPLPGGFDSRPPPLRAGALGYQPISYGHGGPRHGRRTASRPRHPGTAPRPVVLPSRGRARGRFRDRGMRVHHRRVATRSTAEEPLYGRAVIGDLPEG